MLFIIIKDFLLSIKFILLNFFVSSGEVCSGCTLGFVSYYCVRVVTRGGCGVLLFKSGTRGGFLVKIKI